MKKLCCVVLTDGKNELIIEFTKKEEVSSYQMMRNENAQDITNDDNVKNDNWDTSIYLIHRVRR